MQLQPPSECQTDADGNLGSFLGHVWCSALCNRGPVLHPARRCNEQRLARNPRGLKVASLLQRESWTFFSLTRISTVKLVCLTMYIYRFIKFRTFKTSIHNLLSPLAGVLKPLLAVLQWQRVTAWTSGQFTAGPTHKHTSAHNDLQAVFKSLTLSQTSRSLTVTS